MTHKDFSFFFKPDYIHPADMNKSTANMVLRVNVPENVVRSVKAIIEAGAVSHDVAIWVDSILYSDPLLLSALKDNNLDALDALEGKPQVPQTVETHLVVVRSTVPTSGYYVFFRSNLALGSISSYIPLDVFLKWFDSTKKITQETKSDLGGILFYDGQEDMQEFEVPVVRICCSKPVTIKIPARTWEEAKRIALSKAGKYTYFDSEADYEIA